MARAYHCYYLIPNAFFFCFLFLNSVLFPSASLSPACIGEPAGSTLVLRQDEAVQTTRPGVPEGSAQTGALSVQQGKSVVRGREPLAASLAH